MPFFAAVALLCTQAAHALATDDRAIIAGAKLCTNYLPRQERQYGIPVHLLAAIATTESGRYQKQLGMSLPWPWTINVEGRGYFYDSKEEAVAAVKELQERGIKSIDIGCMQVNLHHHPNAFSSVEEAFDPAYNIAYAAQFLKKNFDDEGSWRKATADYHSHTPVFGEPYAGMVFNHWSRIINKVADARAGRLVLKAEPSAGNTSLVANATHPPRHTYQGVHLHAISVSQETSTEKGVLVIRPDYNNTPVQLVASHDRIDNRFVINVSHKPDRKTEDTKPEANKTAEKNVKAPGQFEPGVHIVNISNRQAEDKQFRQNSAFVFDN